MYVLLCGFLYNAASSIAEIIWRAGIYEGYDISLSLQVVLLLPAPCTVGRVA